MKNPFTEHPNNVGETYLEHANYALMMSCKLFGLSVVCIIHAVFPWIHTTTVSKNICKLANQLNNRSSISDK